MYGADDDKREYDDKSKDDHHGATPINPAQFLLKACVIFVTHKYFPDRAQFGHLKAAALSSYRIWLTYLDSLTFETHGALIFQST